MAAAFAFIVGSQICARREIRQKQQQLKGSAKRDGDTSPNTSTTSANCNLVRAVSCPQNFSHTSSFAVGGGRRKPFEVKLSDTDFKSDSAAKLAGE